MDNIVPLELMASGEQGIVVQIDGPGETVHRLAEMGLRERSCVRMVQPGRLCIIAVDEQRFSLRTDDDIEILVSLIPT